MVRDWPESVASRPVCPGPFTIRSDCFDLGTLTSVRHFFNSRFSFLIKASNEPFISKVVSKYKKKFFLQNVGTLFYGTVTKCNCYFQGKFVNAYVGDTFLILVTISARCFTNIFRPQHSSHL